jgi:archaeal cell division control protein 6
MCVSSGNVVDKQDLKRISAEVEKENVLFANKTYLDNLTLPSKILGRERETKELVRFLLGYKQGLVVPFISVYGRSGSGKSTIVKFVCENLNEEDISYAFVNLRKTRTVFGCANLILSALGHPNLKSAQGINTAFEEISNAIEQKHLSNKKKKEDDINNNTSKLFILVLDEFDVLLYDKRGKPSDFIYKLLVIQEKLREKGFLVSIIAVSNNVIADYDIDDRVRSRIGRSEIFFEPYSKEAVLEILKDRSAKAFSESIDSEILEYCADLTFKEHGDVRRAIDLLRVAAEIAGKEAGERGGGGGEVPRREITVSKEHVDLAVGQVQKDRIATILSSASYHLKLAAVAIARISYLTQQVLHSTSILYNQYRSITPKTNRPLTYRRFSELLTELENMGLVISHTTSKGRHGYGTEYKLIVPPEVIGNICSPDWWTKLEQRKKKHDAKQDFDDAFTSGQGGGRHRRRKNSSTLFSAGNYLQYKTRAMEEEEWKRFVGLE